MSKLLQEYFELGVDLEVLKEELKSPEARFTVKGIIQRADVKNQNGRIYPYDILKKECDRYVKEYVDRNMALGQLDHIDSPVIEVKHASHKINKLWWEGKDVWAQIELLKTPMGNIAKEIVLAGIPLGISSRAVGSITKNESQGADVVGDDLQMICFDLVGVPSTAGALLFKEAKDFDPKKIFPPEMRIKQTLKEILKK